MGVDEDLVDVTHIESSDHFQSTTLTQKNDNFVWRLINVYGLVKDNQKQDFQDELEVLIRGVIGGDFNLVRRIEEKSTSNVNLSLMDAFNNFVANTGLREIHRGGGQYTWTNKQINPVMVVLNRIFMNSTWEDYFPLVTTHSITRMGSNHNPLVVELSSDRGVRSIFFLFEAA